MSTLDNLRTAAKRWLKALRANDAEANARLRRAYPRAPVQSGLRDVQHALARERGFESWIALLHAHQTAGIEAHTRVALDLLAAYQSGDAAAIERLRRRYGSSFTLEELRAGVRRRLDAVPEADSIAGAFALPHARLLVAREYGVDNWAALEQLITASDKRIIPMTTDAVLLEPLDLSARMITPVEMRSVLQVRLHDGVMTTTFRSLEHAHGVSGRRPRARHGAPRRVSGAAPLRLQLHGAAPPRCARRPPPPGARAR